MSEIGQRLNISRHRVLQILKDEGLPTMHRIRRYLCECPVCGATSVFKFGSKECKKQWQMIPIICTKRGKLFYRNRHKFPSIIPITMMGHSAAKYALANGSRNIMGSSDTQNIVRPPKLSSANKVKFVYIACVIKRLVDWDFASAESIKEEAVSQLFQARSIR